MGYAIQGVDDSERNIFEGLIELDKIGSHLPRRWAIAAEEGEVDSLDLTALLPEKRIDLMVEADWVRE